MAKKKKTDLRAAINAIALIEALERHVQGDKEMTPSQVSAALALLKKTLPDASDVSREQPSAHEDALYTLE